MKGPVLSAWIAAGLVLAASGARAQQADCDLVCRLQGYLSTDHMAASPGSAAAPSPGGTVRHHPHAAAATKAAAATSKAAPKVATRTEPTVAGKAPAKRSVEAAAKAPPKAVATADPVASSGASVPKAATIIEPRVPKRPASMAQVPHLTASGTGTAGEPKQRVVASATAPDTFAPPAVAAPRRMRRAASTAQRLARVSAIHPVADADLIPGSARLVPAGFQTFGKL